MRRASKAATTAAYSSAQNGRRATAVELIAEAERAAARLPATGAGFSATAVAVYRIGVHTALGDSGTALTSARGVDPHLLPSPERRARHCVDTARAWQAHGRVDRAYEALRATGHYAPEELRRPSVRALITGLLNATGRPPAGLHQLAQRAGVR